MPGILPIITLHWKINQEKSFVFITILPIKRTKQWTLKDICVHHVANSFWYYNNKVNGARYDKTYRKMIHVYIRLI